LDFHSASDFFMLSLMILFYTQSLASSRLETSNAPHSTEAKNRSIIKTI